MRLQAAPETIVKILKPTFLVACGGLVAASLASPAFATEPFDGSWSVNASTETHSPRCKDRAVSLLVENGDVKYAGLMSAFVSGTVDRNGKLLAQIARISVRGRLSESSGSGAWQSPNCTGTWTAHRD